MKFEPPPIFIWVKEGFVSLVMVVTKLMVLRERVSRIMLANPMITAIMMARESRPPVKERYSSYLSYLSISVA